MVHKKESELVFTRFDAQSFRGNVIEIPNGVTSIEEDAFAEKTQTRTIVIPASIRHIDSKAFQGCEKLHQIIVLEEKHYRFSKGILYGVQDHRLIKCVNSISGTVLIPTEVEHIESKAFENCDKIYQIVLNGNMQTIAKDAFWGCSKKMLVHIDVAGIGNNSTYGEKNGCIYIRNNGDCVYNNNNEGKYLTFPGEVKQISEFMVPTKGNLVSVIIEEGVVEIEDNAFNDCRQLVSITIPKSLQRIGKNAFKNCCKLKEIVISSDVQLIGDGAFTNCYSLKRISIPKNIRHLPNGLFENCILLKDVSLEYGLLRIGERTFSGCSSLRRINLPKSVFYIGAYAFQCCGLRTFIFPQHLDYLGESPFFLCGKLREIHLPKLCIKSLCSSALALNSKVTYYCSKDCENIEHIQYLRHGTRIKLID